MSNLKDYVPMCIYEEGECIECDLCNPSPIKLWENKLKELQDEEKKRRDNKKLENT